MVEDEVIQVTNAQNRTRFGVKTTSKVKNASYHSGKKASFGTGSMKTANETAKTAALKPYSELLDKIDDLKHRQLLAQAFSYEPTNNSPRKSNARSAMIRKRQLSVANSPSLYNHRKLVQKW